MIVDSEVNDDEDLFKNRIMIFPDNIIKTNLPSIGAESRLESRIIRESTTKTSNFSCEMYRGDFLVKFNLNVGDDKSNGNHVIARTYSEIQWLYNHLTDLEQTNLHILPPKPYPVSYDFAISKILEFDQKAMEYDPYQACPKNLRYYVNSELMSLNTIIFELFISSLMENEPLRENLIAKEFLTNNSMKFSEGAADSMKNSLNKIRQNFPAFQQKSCPKTKISRLQMERIIKILMELISIYLEVHMKEIVVLNEICTNFSKEMSEEDMMTLKLAKMNLVMIEDFVKSKIFKILFVSISRVTGALHSLEIYHKSPLNQPFNANNQKNHTKDAENLNTQNFQNKTDMGLSIEERLSSVQKSPDAVHKVLQYSLQLVDSLCKFTIVEVTDMKNELINLIEQTE